MTSAAPVSRLRGARVEVDARRAAQVVVVLGLTALAAAAAILFAAAATRNAQISDLRAHGVPVAVRVSGCQGLLGGSGSNPVGYSCTGTYSFAGHSHTVTVPGDALYAPGTTIRGVTAPDDTGLLSTPGVLAGERATGTAFLLPAALVGVLALSLAGLGWRSRRRRGRVVAAPGPSVAPAAQVGGV